MYSTLIKSIALKNIYKNINLLHIENHVENHSIHQCGILNIYFKSDPSKF